MNIREFKPLIVLKDVAKEVYGQSQTNGPKKNAIALVLTFAPNVPAYFMPSFNQASATGSAKELREQEGKRGIMTGVIEGANIGVVTATASSEISFDVPRILKFGLFMGVVDCMWGKVLSRVGEEAGKKLYESRLKRGKISKPTQVQPVNRDCVQDMRKQILNKKA